MSDGESSDCDSSMGGRFALQKKIIYTTVYYAEICLHKLIINVINVLALSASFEYLWSGSMDVINF